MLRTNTKIHYKKNIPGKDDDIITYFTSQFIFFSKHYLKLVMAFSPQKKIFSYLFPHALNDKRQ